MRTVRVSGWMAVVAIAMLVGATATVGATAGRGGGPAGNDGDDGTPTPIACTQEAKLCDDGSAAGRTELECKFDPCPLEQGAGVVKGTVTVGPLEPVETPGTKMPVPPEVYESRWLVFTGQGGQYVKTVPINSDGTYAAWLWPGTYTVDINHAGIDFAKGLPKEITIHESETITLDVDIDTGIR